MEDNLNKKPNKDYFIGDKKEIKDYINQRQMEENNLNKNKPVTPPIFTSSKGIKTPLEANQNTKPITSEETTPSSNPTLRKARYESLQDRDTNFIFLFGDPGSGKTAITSALCYHMSTDESGGDVSLNRKSSNLDGKLLLRDILERTRRGEFMERTVLGNVFEIDLVFEPHRPKIPLNFTFLDMSGEDLKMIAAGRNEQEGKFDNNIEEYLNCPRLRILFILVIPVQESLRIGSSETDEDFIYRKQNHFVYQDYLARTFVEHVKSKKYHTNPNILLLVSKWDEYEGKHKETNDIAAYVKEKLPIINTKLTSVGNISYFSVGTVEDNTITEFSHERPRIVKNWIYKKIHNIDLNPTQPVSIIDKMKNFFGGK